MYLRSNPLDREARKSPFGTFSRKVVKMKMLQIYFAFSGRKFLYLCISNTNSFQPFSAQPHQKPCVFTVVFIMRDISYQETNWSIYPLGFLICPLRPCISPLTRRPI